MNKFNFIVIADRLYRADPATGETWYNQHGQWVKVKE